MKKDDIRQAIELLVKDEGDRQAMLAWLEGYEDGNDDQ